MIIVILVLFVSLNSCSDSRQNESLKTGSLQKDTCDDADGDAECYFLNMPEAINSVIKIADENEPGRRMIIKGKILTDDSVTPLSDIIIYAYHTDNSGYYTKKGNEKGIQKWHGHLHGWGKTDASGNYEINSIRPARYPGNRFPAHIHAVLKIPGKIPFYINDFVFKDDSLVNKNYTGSLIYQGGTGVVELKENPENVLHGERNIFLILNNILNKFILILMNDKAKYKTSEIIWRDLTVKNADELKTFYESVTGWKTTPHSMGDYDDYVVMLPEKNKDGGEDAVAGICYARGTNAKIPPQWLMYVRVEDLSLSLEKCKNLGGEIIDGPRKMREDNFCVIKDPEGAVIALMSI